MGTSGDSVARHLAPVLTRNLIPSGTEIKFYIFLLGLLIVVLLLFPYVDANFFYYDRVEKRVSILKEIAEIDQEKLSGNAVLQGEYESILMEIDKQKDGSFGSIFITDSSKEVKNGKFFTGASVLWLIAIVCFFIKFDPRWHMILGFMLFFVLGTLMGYISELIPTIIKPTINYVLMPSLQILLLGFAISSSSTKKKK